MQVDQAAIVQRNASFEVDLPTLVYLRWLIWSLSHSFLFGLTTKACPLMQIASYA
jgi:hypothetical protein